MSSLKKTLNDVKEIKHLMLEPEIEYLYDKAKTLGYSPVVVNIGVYYGASAAALALRPGS